MRCRTVQRSISDEIDGSLAPRRRRRLEKHLTVCPSCRAYRGRLLALQAKAAPGPVPSVPAGYWEGSLERLRTKLESVRPDAEKRKGAGRPVFVKVPRWAWAGVPVLLAAAAGLFFVLGPSRTALERFPLSQEDAAGRLAALIGSDEALESEFADLIQASILEFSEAPDGDIQRLLYADSRFLEGLTETELQRLETHLAGELKI